MKKCMVLALSIVLIGSGVIANQALALQIAFQIKSVSCAEVITGVSRPELNDDNVVCAIRITEILRACTNKPFNSDTANGTPYQVNAEIIKVNLGTALPLSKTGKSFSEITFSDAEIAAFLGDLVNPAVVCPNPGWHVIFTVSRFDGIGEVLGGASSQPGGACSVDPTAFSLDSCAVSAGASVCLQKECLRVSPCVKDHLDLSKPDTVSCTCAEHIVSGDPANKCIYGIK